jgi:hypothetical protein
MSGSTRVRSSFFSSLQQIPDSGVGLAHLTAGGVVWRVVGICVDIGKGEMPDCMLTSWEGAGVALVDMKVAVRSWNSSLNAE